MDADADADAGEGADVVVAEGGEIIPATISRPDGPVHSDPNADTNTTPRQPKPTCQLTPTLPTKQKNQPP